MSIGARVRCMVPRPSSWRAREMGKRGDPGSDSGGKGNPEPPKPSRLSDASCRRSKGGHVYSSRALLRADASQKGQNSRCRWAHVTVLLPPPARRGNGRWIMGGGCWGRRWPPAALEEGEQSREARRRRRVAVRRRSTAGTPAAVDGGGDMRWAGTGQGSADPSRLGSAAAEDGGRCAGGGAGARGGGGAAPKKLMR